MYSIWTNSMQSIHSGMFRFLSIVSDLVKCEVVLYTSVTNISEGTVKSFWSRLRTKSAKDWTWRVVVAAICDPCLRMLEWVSWLEELDTDTTETTIHDNNKSGFPTFLRCRRFICSSSYKLSLASVLKMVELAPKFCPSALVLNQKYEIKRMEHSQAIIHKSSHRQWIMKVTITA